MTVSEVVRKVSACLRLETFVELVPFMRGVCVCVIVRLLF